MSFVGLATKPDEIVQGEAYVITPQERANVLQVTTENDANIRLVLFADFEKCSHTI
jgi:hypothetical protein